jgi:hypothetical protein
MAGSIRKSRVREIPLSEVKDDLSHLLREASVARIERSEIRVCPWAGLPYPDFAALNPGYEC